MNQITVRHVGPSFSYFVGAEAAWKVVEHEDGHVEVWRNAGRGWRKQPSMPNWLGRLIHEYDLQVVGDEPE